jgi:hypothetical protein
MNPLFSLYYFDQKCIKKQWFNADLVENPGLDLDIHRLGVCGRWNPAAISIQIPDYHIHLMIIMRIKQCQAYLISKQKALHRIWI